MMDAKKQAHADLIALWDRWKALQKNMLALQADLGELDTAVHECGKRIYDLYQRSDGGLDGENLTTKGTKETEKG